MKQLSFIAVFFLNVSLGAQQSAVEFIWENSGREDDEIGMAMLVSVLEELEMQPLNINLATKEELHECMLFSDFQVHILLEYRAKYGDFLSVYELQSIPGFSRTYLESLQKYICLDKELRPYRKSKGMLLHTMSIRLPYTEIYQKDSLGNSLYIGNPWKYSSRLTYEFKSGISAGVCIEKDPGELILNSDRIEHLSAYLQIDGKRIDRLIIGNYRLQSGAGLVNGFGLTSSWENKINSYRLAGGKAFASTMEYDYYRGAYAMKQLGRWQISANYSRKPEDISFFSFENKGSLFEAIRTTGYHRTSAEINGQNLAGMSSWGASVGRGGEWFHFGSSLQSSQVKLNERGLDSVPDAHFQKSYRGNFSYSQLISLQKANILSEFALTSDGKFAFFSSGEMYVNPAFSMSASYRYYQNGYYAQYPCAYTSSSLPGNENGISLGVRIIPYNYFELHLFCDFHKELYSLHAVGKNIEGRGRIKLSYVPKGNFSAFLQITNTKISTDQTRQKQNIRVHYSYLLLENLKLQGRLEKHYFLQEKEAAPAQMIYQQFQLAFRRNITFLYRIAYFDVPDWNTRIYSYEPGLKYSFLFPAWYGHGMQNLFTLSWKTQHKLVLRFKYAQTHYAHQHFCGSSPERSSGDTKHQLEFQLELKL